MFQFLYSHLFCIFDTLFDTFALSLKKKRKKIYIFFLFTLGKNSSHTLTAAYTEVYLYLPSGNIYKVTQSVLKRYVVVIYSIIKQQ